MKKGMIYMDSRELIALNMKWYRYQLGLTQERFAEITKFKTAYISIIETGNVNLTVNSLDEIAKSLNIKSYQLFVEETAIKAKSLPHRVDSYVMNNFRRNQ